MKEELNFYDIYPKVLLAGKESIITIKPLDERYDFISSKYIIKIVPLNEAMNYDFTSENSMELDSKENTIKFKCTFKKEQEYYINLYTKEIDDEEERIRKVVQLSVYAVEEDLYNKIPLKGDLHAHSYKSDGNESPAVVAANYRKAGFDFFALTDHYRYNPSLEAIKAYEEIKIDLNIIRGEEVHSPNNYVHVINFGGEHSVNEIFQSNIEKYKNEVEEIIKTVEGLPDDIDKFIYSACLWVSNKIREANGMSIFCHPFWIYGSYNVSPTLSTTIINNKVFDAFELLGGQSVHENNMQTALYNDARIRGKNEIPIVGSSDSHGTIHSEIFNAFETIVFSVNNEKDSIINAIKNLYSVAIEHDKGKEYRVYGSLRLVNYTRFLMDNYLPIHHNLCEEEGRLMREYYLGIENSKDSLERLSGRCDKLYNKYFR